MEEVLNKIRNATQEQEINISEVKTLLTDFIRNYLKGLHIDNYIGDYPTFMEPVYLGDAVKIGDDVLIGPNVYVGEKSEISDYVELSNTIIFKNVKLGNNVKLENCIVVKDSLIADNTHERNCVLFGLTDSKSDKISF